MADTKGTDIARRLSEAPAERPKTLIDYVEGLRPEIARALPKGLDADRIVRIAITSLRMTPKLAECSRMSFIGALMQSAQLGLEPNTPLGEAYLIPYKNGDGYDCQFQLGYKGILALAHRTGEYQTIYARAAYANDKFSYQYGLNPDLLHIPADDPEGEPTYYYAVYRLKNGGSDFVVWSRAKMEAHARRFSAAYKAGRGTPWKSDFDAMALKTMVKQVLNYAPKSIEFDRQLSMDETVKTQTAADMSEVTGEIIYYGPEAVTEYEELSGHEEDNAGPKATEQDPAAPAIPKVESPENGSTPPLADDDDPLF